MSNHSKISQEVLNLLDPYDSSQTECDGMVRICCTVLAQHGIEHQPMIGILSRKQREIDPHFCINLPSGERIDYRAKLWLGNSKEIPHGVFQPSNFSTAIYKGEPVELELLSPVLFKILTSAVQL